MENESEFNLDIANNEQKRAIKEIEALNIGPRQKVDLILVLLGVKKGTDLAVYRWNDSPEKVSKTITDNAKLKLTPLQREFRNINIVALYGVARDQATAEQLARLDSAKDHEEFGKIMSFPQTAIEAFGKKENLLKQEDYPDTSDIIVSFKLSKDHWQEEIELLKYWSELVKKYAPDLYVKLKEAKSKERG